MSIVVTCSCTRTYRLPDRYAGKRCRCRDCGKKIEVPAEPADAEVVDEARTAKARRGQEERLARRSRKKDDPSKTTRRLSSQDQEILGERRRIRHSQRAKPVSESMHQLAPMTLSGDLPIAPPPKKNAAPAATPLRAPRRKGKDAADSRKESPEPKGSKASKAKTTKSKAKDATPTKASRAKRSTTKPKGKAEVDDTAGRPKRRKATRSGAAPAAGRARGKAEPRRAATHGRRRSREDEDASPRGRKPAPHRLPVVIGIAGALCMGIGLVIGGLFASRGDAASPALSKRLADLDALKANRQWAAAEAEVIKLQAELEAAGDAEGLARLRAASPSIKKMAALAGIEDEETRLLNLVTYASDADATVRLGVAHELRSLAEASEDAQRALAALAADQDPRVAQAARHSLVQAGGPLAIPYLAQTIEETAASGHKLGDVALERALELSDPAVVPVLVTALKHRASAPPSVLKAILSRLEEYGDASVKDAVTPFASNADEGVAAAAKAVLEAIGG